MIVVPVHALQSISVGSRDVSITLNLGEDDDYFTGDFSREIAFMRIERWSLGPASNRPRLIFFGTALGYNEIVDNPIYPRGCSSVGRAPDLHSGGRRFDPDQLHQL